MTSPPPPARSVGVTVAPPIRPALLALAAAVALPAAASGQSSGALGPLWAPAGPVAPAAPWGEPVVRPVSGFGGPALPAGPPAPGYGEPYGDPYAPPQGFAPPAPGPPPGTWTAPPEAAYRPPTAGPSPAGPPAEYGPPGLFEGPAPDDAPPLIAPPPLACAGQQCGRPFGRDDGPPPALLDRSLAVRLDTPTSAALLDFQNRQTDKQLLLLGSLPTVVPHPVLVPAAQMRLSALYGRTNTRGKFGYLGRFPPDFSGNTAGDLRILQANLAARAYFTPWASGYVETLFSDVFSFPSPNQGSFQVRQAYAVFGDVRRFPLYAFIGKKTVSYGDFGTLSPFTQAAPWHYFAALGEGAGVGYVNGGFHAVLTGLSGGRGIRTVDSPARGKVNNFAFNTFYAGRSGRLEYLVGAGYLDGTIYNAATPEHIDPDLFGPQNGAWDVNGTLRYGRATFAGEYVQTNRAWPVTDHKVSAYKAEGAYDLVAAGRPLRLSASWSEGRQAPRGLEFDRNAQLVLGAGWQLNPNALLSLEYVRSIGFAPLIGLTAPRVSDRDVRQDSLVLGVSLVL